MRSVAAACPFCNAELPPLAEVPTTARVPCQRCGEPVPSERFPVQPTAIAAGPPPTPTVLPADGKRVTLQVVLSIMAGMAALALTFALLTREIRRQRDPKLQPAPLEELAQSPAELLALGFLPKGTNVVAALHVTALTRDPAGQALLREPRPAVVDKALEPLAMCGLTVDDLDHVVLGSEIKDLSFQFTTVMVTRKPYDPGQLKQAVERRPVNATTYRKGTLYRFTDLPRIPKLWCAEARVLVYSAMAMEDMDRIPAAKNDATAALTPGARAALSGRLGKQNRLWAVGDLEPAQGLVEGMQKLGFLPKEQTRLLTLVRAFAVGVAPGEKASLTLTGDFRTASQAGAQELRGFLEQVTLAKVAAQTAMTPPEAEASWVTWQVRAEAEAVREALGKLPFGQRKQKTERPPG